ncbi:hypothetical protein GCM10018966_045410 [Streptomyces yanii]
MQVQTSVLARVSFLLRVLRCLAHPVLLSSESVRCVCPIIARLRWRVRRESVAMEGDYGPDVHVQ